MTGGLGFSRTGQNSVKQNRDLKNARSRMKDNPYGAGKNIDRQTSGINYKKLKAWMNDKNVNEKKTGRIIYLVLITILFLFLIIVRLTN